MLFPLRDTVPTLGRPVMTWALIAVTSAVFGWEALVHPQHLREIITLFGLVPARLSHPAWAQRVGFPAGAYWPLVTSVFLHTGILHLASNMWFLWIFGDNVEDRLGPWRFLGFYLLCGVIAGLVQFATSLHSPIPTVGASGAIAGVLGAYLVLYPRGRVVTLLLLVFWPLVFEVPALFYLVYWFALQLVSGTTALLGPQQLGGIAWWAHIGGFVAGAVSVRLFIARRDGMRPREYSENRP